MSRELMSYGELMSGGTNVLDSDTFVKEWMKDFDKTRILAPADYFYHFPKYTDKQHLILVKPLIGF